MSIKKLSLSIAFTLITLTGLFAQVNILTQGFEALPFPPTGWSNVRMTGPSFPGNWARYGNGIAPVQTPHTGSWQIRFNSANFGAGTSGELRTAVLNFTTAGTYSASFWMYRDNWVGNDKLEVFVNTSQTSVGATLLGTINRDRAQSPAVGVNGWYQYSFSIPAAFNTATNYIIFKSTSAFGKDIYVDDISVDRFEPSAPGCVTTFSPANGATGLCTNATLSWAIVPLASGYKVSLGTNAPDYNNVLNNIDLGVALSYTSVFATNTTYGWKVTPYNGYGDAIGCTANTFTTGTSVCYGIPVYLEGSCGTEDYIDDVSTTGGITNITNNNSGCTTNPNNYTYFAGQTVTVVQGNSFNISMQAGPDFPEGFGVWIDYNIDGDFNDAGEYVFNSPSPTIEIVNGTITVPYEATVGLSRMRIRCAYNYVPTSGTSMATFNEGETQDYDVQINPCPTTITYFADSDGDLFGNLLAPITKCSGAPVPLGYVLNNTDCNDANAAIKPGATEICNGIDDNCNGTTDEGLTFINYYTDADADGFGSSAASPVNACSPIAGKVANNTDCNDGNAAIKPSAIEVCNGIDDNCSGGADEGLIFVNYYTDADSDGFGNSGVAPVNSCTSVIGSVTNNTDCNDGNAAIKPGATEVCNAVDDNCNGSTDEGLIFVNYYIDNDEDGFGSAIATPVNSCNVVPGFAINNTDCNDANAAIKPGATEICNAIDDNCSGAADEGLIFVNYFTDSDADGFGSAAISPINSCNVIPGAVLNNTDCNDANAAIKPGAVEICNAIDDDCDALTDEGVATAIITPAGPTTFCSGGTVMLQATPTIGNTYQWIRNGANISGAISANYTTNKSGNYQVRVTVPGGCNLTSATTTVTVIAAPKATVTTPGGTDLCGVASVLLKTSNGAGFTFQWIRNGANIAGATVNTYNATTVGNYKVTVTNASGCSKTSATTAVSKSCKLSDEIDAISMDVYPNPATDIVSIALQYAGAADNESVFIEVYDLEGKRIDGQTWVIQNGETIANFNVSNWASGLYLVKANCNGMVLTSRIVVTK